ncbi:MAG TPA: PAS domain S-box protein [Puia sp.]|uniref:PAS domain S-box protein n=1 Tax=Puia sp. TaxID=2045100 RepID=UPI002C41C55A|nr:PAS domain S-box protein [Puia sp.]HVU97704.1 PAS domain S-box protein [Puia sp.]
MDGDIRHIHILVVEDNPGDLFLFKEFLNGTDLPVAEVRHAASLAEARQLLAIHSVDLLFLDLSLPDSFGLESYTLLQPFTQRVAVILLTGLNDTKIAMQALVMGAQDYLVKGDFDEKLLSRAIRYSLERLRNLQYLRESEERYRELFNNNPMPMWVFDAKSFRFLEANSSAVQHYGYTHEEFLGKSLADIRLDGNRDELRVEVEAVREKRDGVKKGIRQHVKKNGEIIFVDIAWHSISYKNQPAVLVLANDVTERIQLENELNEQRVTRQRQITEAVILAQEKERTEIGKELHDNVNQILGASNLYINTAMTDDEMRQELLERSTELVSKAINEIRKISKSLITPGLREIGLIESVEDVIDDMKLARADLGIELDLQNITEEQIEDKRKLTVFRIVQEQLNNIVKHARATRVLIRLSMEGSDLVVTVADNGVGFDVGRHRKGVGITNIISRAELFSGTVEIQSQPGEGTTLTVSLPT